MTLKEVRLSVSPWHMLIYILKHLGIWTAFVRSLSCQDIILTIADKYRRDALHRLPRVKTAREQKINNDYKINTCHIESIGLADTTTSRAYVSYLVVEYPNHNFFFLFWGGHLEVSEDRDEMNWICSRKNLNFSV